MTQSKDLFDDTTMTFGEHLEVLRVHLFKALIGLAVAVVICLIIGDKIIAVVRAPIDAALLEHGVAEFGVDDIKNWSLKEYYRRLWGDKSEEPVEGEGEEEETRAIEDEDVKRRAITVELSAEELAKQLHQINPKYPEPPAEATGDVIRVTLFSEEFATIKKGALGNKPITLNVQEAFLTYIKVSVIAGLLFSSPWIFYQIWLFVAAGLYPHEKKYVRTYLPLSVFLFMGGAAFCFLAVFPYVLQFLLSFNVWLGAIPQIRLSEWISFAVILPLMFGISFQLPIVMLFLERISVFDVQSYREKRRMSILIIAVVSMMMTPSDPMSMILMAVPLVLLYEFGIMMCGFTASPKSPFEAEAA